VNLVRLIINPPKGKDGLFIQPKEVGPERERDEQHNRERLAAKADYADPFTGNPRTFDPDGNYRCGDCNQDNHKHCLLVRVDKVDEKAGSCGKYEDLCAGDAEIPSKWLTVETAGYAIAANGEGFGCHRCPFASDAPKDSQGRDLYCGKGDCRVFWNACCNLNGAEEVPIDAHGMPLHEHEYGDEDMEKEETKMPEKKGDDSKKKPEKKHLHQIRSEETDDGHILHHHTFKKKRGDTETEPERKNVAVSSSPEEAGQHVDEQFGMNQPPPPDSSAAAAAPPDGGDPSGGGAAPGPMMGQ
jgi:hypothetical protein